MRDDQPARRGDLGRRRRGGTEYLIRVAPLANSVTDTFVLRVVAPDEPATAPGSLLPSTGTAATVDRFANPDDAWYVDLVGGRTYRMNFVTKGDGCADVELFPAGTKHFGNASPIRHRSCDAHTVFVASRTGRYPILVSAPRASRDALPYRLRVGLALADDSAPRSDPAVDSTLGGRLRGSELDALDLYRFGVARRSDMRIHLGTDRRFQLTLMTAGGRSLGSARHTIERRLARGRYYVAVTALDGADGAYTLRRHARAITTARTLADGQRKAYTSPGRTVSLSLLVSPAVSGPSTMLVERFDPIEGWLFAARLPPDRRGRPRHRLLPPVRTGPLAGDRGVRRDQGGQPERRRHGDLVGRRAAHPDGTRTEMSTGRWSLARSTPGASTTW